MSLYKEILLDHFKNPRHYDRDDYHAIWQPNFIACEANPLCGDLIQIKGLVQNGKLAKAVFSGSGCVISQATASILLEKYLGAQVDLILNLTSTDVLGLIGMELGPNRIKCALLALVALQDGVNK